MPLPLTPTRRHFRPGDDGPLPSAATLVELLQHRASTWRGSPGFRFLTDGESDEVTLDYATLDARARAIAATLLASGVTPGERALLLYPPGLEYITGFFACLYAGIIAVPVYPPNPGRLERSLPRIRNVIVDAQATVALTTSVICQLADTLSGVAPELGALAWIATDDPTTLADADTWRAPQIGPSSLAFLQYTSGSTGSPRGVMLTHQNLLHNSALISAGFDLADDARAVIWLPPYHDMGLIGGILQPLYRGITAVLMSPIAFLERPMRWLEALSRHGGTVSGGPNFAFDLCVRKSTPAERAALDLSRWEVAFTGAEPVRAATLDRFCAAFEASGFDRRAFYPCYGLAEATLIVAGGRRADPPVVRAFAREGLERGVALDASDADGAQTLVASGRSFADQQVVVVDPMSGRRCAAREVGEILVAGPSVAAGYWGREVETRETFGATVASEDGATGPFLRTGDLGLLDEDGELFVTGRAKDVMVVRGRNWYPQDLEATAEQSHPLVRPGCSAAFSVDVAGEERAVIVVEYERRYNADRRTTSAGDANRSVRGPSDRRQDEPEVQAYLPAVTEEITRGSDRPESFDAERVTPHDVVTAVRQAIGETYGLAVEAIVLVKAGTVPKTSSGKIQRSNCRAMYLDGTLDALHAWRADAPEVALSDRGDPPIVLPAANELSGPIARRVARWLVPAVARLAGSDIASLDLHAPITRHGLDSLRAVELQNAVEARTGTRLPIEWLLRGPSLHELIERVASSHAHARTLPTALATVRDDAPLSEGQRALWFLHQRDPTRADYNIARAARIDGPLDIAALEQACAALISRHAALRTTFHEAGGQPFQRIAAMARPDFAVIDARGLDDAALRARLETEAHLPFDLAAGVLRVRVFVRENGVPVLLVSVHHIAADLWSLTLVARELGALYDAERHGDEAALAPPGARYVDHVAWEAAHVGGPDGEADWVYWRQRLGGEIPALDLPSAHWGGPVEDGVFLVRRGADATRAAHALASAHDTTPYIALLAALGAALARCSGARDVVVGSPAAGRGRAAFAGVVGYFVNPVALRLDVAGARSGDALVEHTRDVVLGALAHQHFPFARLVERLAPARGAERVPLFRVAFALQRAPHTGLDEAQLARFALGEEGARLPLGTSLTLEGIALAHRAAPFDLGLSVAEIDGAFVVRVEHAIDEAAARTVVAALDAMLTAMADRPAAPIASLPLVDATTRAHLLAGWNPAPDASARSQTLDGLFEAHAQRTPDAVALVHGETASSYRDLDARANRLANHLRSLGVVREARVGLLLERSTEAVVAILAVLKAGGAYVPLDPSYPADRLAFMARDAGLRVLLTIERLAARIPSGVDAPYVCLDSEASSIATYASTRPAGRASDRALALVVYTSGSTGRPNGVLIEHRGMVRLVVEPTGFVDVRPDDHVAQVATLAFDVGNYELFAALTRGARSVIVPDDVALAPGRLAAFVRREAISVLHLTVGLLDLVAREEPDALASVRDVLFGGDAPDPRLARRVLERSAPARLIEMYGPTETSTFASRFALRTVPDDAVGLPIGRPVARTTLYVLDARMEPTPLGVVGDLYVGGDGVARGYLDRAALTAQRYLPDPFAGEPGARLYRTGDLGRRLATGDVEFAGRADQQVKIRGYRVEPGEVEAVIATHAAVAQAVVVVRRGQEGGAQLVAYVVPTPGTEAPTVEALRAFVRTRLPEYMVPTAFVRLRALPLTPNGKLDRRALPAPDHEARAGAAYALPRTGLERDLAAIWAAVLGLERVGQGDDFFDLGGHSLLATQVVSRVREAFGVELSVRALFDARTVAAVAARIEVLRREGLASDAPPLTPAVRGVTAPRLSFAQERMWFLEKLEPGGAAYVIPAALHLEGVLDTDALRAALESIVARHEVLRTTFAVIDDKPVQRIGPPFALPIDPVQLEDIADLHARRADARRRATALARLPFDLATGPLLRVELYRLGPREHVLAVAMHHVVSDGWSASVLVRELCALYEAFRAGSAAPLAPLAVQYADFAVWQRTWLEGGALAHQLAWWRERLDGAPFVQDVPSDHPRGRVFSYRGARVPVHLAAETVAAIESLARREGVTTFMVLLTAFGVLMQRHTGVDDVVVGTDVANRNRTEVEPLIGFFVNQLVLRTQLGGGPTVREALGRARETTLGAYAHQDAPFDALVRELAPARDPARAPLFQTKIVLQNAPELAFALPGLAIRAEEVETGAAQLDLLLALAPADGALTGALEYASDLFDAATIVRLVARFGVLVSRMIADPSRSIDALDVLPDGERARLLRDWNDTRIAWRDARDIPALIGSAADASPDAWAVVHASDGPLSYGALMSRSRRLARHLRAMGVTPGTPVAVCLAPSSTLVVAVVAVLMAGGAYVPLDPAYPPERLAFMVGDALAPVVVTTSGLADELPVSTAQLFCVDTDEALLAGYDDGRLPPPDGASAAHIAYVIYTSGSTHRPKGVAVAHAAFASSTRARLHFYREPVRAFLLLSSIAFDSSVAGLFWTLCQGGALVLPDETSRRDPAQLAALSARHGVSHLLAVPTLYQHLLAYADALAPTLRVAIVAGETCSVALVRAHTQRLPTTALYNEYGPTEAAVWTTVADARAVQGDGPVPIGRPIANAETLVLDRHGRLAPLGVPGELAIGGDGLARGYLGRPGLTAERFVPHPFAREPGARLYRSGDTVRWRADGELEFLGRRDGQVKVRGYRIELGEIESALANVASVAHAVVVARETTGGEPQLVAYVVAVEEAHVTADTLAAALGRTLPGYMVPSVFVQLDALPRLPNGKVDRGALPAPGQGTAPRASVPDDPVADLVAGVWAELLRRPRIGHDDNFFELGGQSLLATMVVTRMRAVSGVELPLSAVFEAPTPARFAERIRRATAAGDRDESAPIVPVARDGAPMRPSFAQERMWFLDQLSGGGVAYAVPAAVRLRGALDVESLARALAGVVARHDVLRTRFVATDDGPVQVIDPPGDFQLVSRDVTSADPVATAQALAVEDTHRGFDLARGPVLRATLLRFDTDDHVLLLTMHHVAADGWSVGVLVREVCALYTGATLAPLAVQYADWAAWQRAWLATGVLDREVDWWRVRLADAPASLDLPTDRPRPAVQTDHGARLGFAVPTEVTAALATRARADGATPFMVLLAAFAALLARYAGENDVVIGTPIANRTRAETEPLIGFFVNTLALRVDLAGRPTVREAIAHARETALGAYLHQELPFERLVESLGARRDASRSPVFQTMLVLQNTPDAPITLPGLSADVLDVDAGLARFDLTLGFVPKGDELIGAIEYNTDLFDRATVARIAGHFVTLLARVVDAPDTRLDAIDILAPDERATLLVDWNATTVAYPDSSALHALVEAQVARTPDAPAVFDGDTVLTYRTLDRRANSLAASLIAHGVAADRCVALVASRSAALVVATLAVLKAGGAFVPLDPAAPHARLVHAVRDAGARLVLADEDAVDFGVPVLALAEVTRAEAEAPPNAPTHPHALCYVIYTSGSTGTPRGVMVDHRAVVNIVTSFARTYGLHPRDRVLHQTSPAFDVSINEVFPALVTGAAVVIARGDDARDFDRLARLVDANAVTVLGAVPSVLARIDATPGAWTSVRLVLSGGEALADADVDALKTRATVVNGYGPTETTVAATSFDLATARVPGTRVPIGRPLANYTVYVLDARLQPVPIGCPGEICVGGPGVARGYLGAPGRTAERFVPDPFAPGQRLYRTGDLGRWRAEGQIEFLGRRDGQVKLRGYRIELGEIEAALARLPALLESAVVVHDDARGRRLVGYVVARDDHAPTPAALREGLAATLPGYMIPAVFVALDVLPRTPNGKIDRRALPSPPQPDETPGAPPRGAVEIALAGIWREVLGVEQVGRDDDFFDRGGHSLLATQVVSRVRRTMGLELPLRALFEAPTLAALAARIAALRSPLDASLPEVEPRVAGAPAVLSFAQERLWFLDQMHPGDPAYNIPGAVRLVGPLDSEALARAVQAVVDRHEALRTTFDVRDGRPVQIVHASQTICLAHIDLTALAIGLREEAAMQRAADEALESFDLRHGPLLRATLVRLDAHDHVLLLTMHHIVSDGWSVGVLGHEVCALYAGASLAPLSLQYADWAAWQRAWLECGELATQLAWWRTQLEGAPPALDLVTDRPRPPVQGHRGAQRPIALGRDTSHALEALARDVGATPYMVLLAAFGALLSRYTGQHDLVLGSPIANRTRAESEALIGVFINSLAMRLDLAHSPSFRTLLGRVRATALDAFARQDAPFEKLVEVLAPDRDLSRPPLFQVLFVLQNAPSPPISLPGLEARAMSVASVTAKYELTLELARTHDGYAGTLEYAVDLFDGATIDRMASHLVRLIEAAVRSPDTRVDALAILSPDERATLLDAWNATDAAPSHEATVHAAIEAQVRRTPDAIALITSSATTRYTDLDRRANRIARRLQAHGIGRGARVGVCMPRSVDLVATLLAVSKTGAAYVPLDPDYPPARLGYMARDAGLSALVTLASLAARVEAGAAHVVRLDTEEDALARLDDGPVRADVGGRDAAYVIYTSGSTGQPKGVVVEHAQVANFFIAMDARLGDARSPGTWLAVTSVSFDIAVLELLWTLARGFRVVVQPPAPTRARPRATRTQPASFSLFYFASDDASARGGDPYRLLLEGARFADDHDFEAVWTPERHFHAFGGAYPNPSVLSAALAASTRRVGIRAGSVVAPLHHPVRIAEEWSVVDNLSHGRVAVSFASGWHADDFVFAPARFADRRRAMIGHIETVRRLWRGEAVEFPNGAGRATAVQVHPRPVQPELPVWLTAAANPETFALAGEIGANVLTHLLGQSVEELGEKVGRYRAAREAHGFDPAAGRVTVMVHTFVHEDAATVTRLASGPFGEYLRSSIDLMRAFGRSLGVDIDVQGFSASDLDALVARGVQRYFGSSGLFGTPDSCAAMIERLESAGVDEIACLVDFGIDADEVLAALPALDRLRQRTRGKQPAIPIADQLLRHAVTHLQCTPSLARTLVDDPTAHPGLAGLRAMLVGGEVLPTTLAEALRARVGGAVINLYGPTETTVWSTTHALEGDVTDGVPIGRPLANTRVYVLDAQGEPAPIGVPGELYIGGDGVTRGYLARPSRTAERFVPDAFAARAGARLYRTGDRARWTADGVLAFLGRRDQQVKLRGHRIELGEIETALERIAGVSAAAVVLREDAGDEARLVAYLVAAPGVVEPARLREALAGSLPEYMLPAAFVALDALPRTPGGKLDRRALPAPTQSSAPTVAYEPPATATEVRVAAIWAEVLGVARVGRHDDFFALGGHSLRATQAVIRARESLGVGIELLALFEAPVLEAFCARVDASDALHEPPIVPVARDGAMPLSFAQERLWFLDQLDPGVAVYNIPTAMRLRGVLDVVALGRTLDELVSRHEALRTTFAAVDGEARQFVAPAHRVPLDTREIAGGSITQREAEARRIASVEAVAPFDLARGPLLRATLLRLAPDDHVLLLTVHHIVSDGWSAGVLVRELIALYTAFAAGQPSPLAALAVQYGDYAVWQRGWLTGARLDARLTYWQHALADAPRVLDLPTDRPRARVQSFRGAQVDRTLPATATRAVHELARREDATTYMVLLAAWALLLARHAGVDDVLIGSPIANRNQPVLEGLVGFFTNTLVMRVDARGEPTARALIARVRATTRGAFAHQDAPFERLVDRIGAARSLDRSPVFQAMFILQNAPMPALASSSLTMAPLETPNLVAKFDVTLLVEETDAGLVTTLHYATDLFDAATMHALLARYATLLQSFVRRIDAPAFRLPMLPDDERARLLTDWNATDRPRDPAATLHGAFEAQVARAPDAIALVADELQWTYAVLDRRADSLAHSLRARGVGREVRVAICAERSVELIVAMLAVLKAGGAFVPLDPGHPTERLAFMLRDVEARLVLTQRAWTDRLPDVGIEVLVLDAAVDVPTEARADGGATGADLAYIVFTSGSTGRPKGVMVTHAGVANHAAALQQNWPMAPSDAMLYVASPGFDIAVWEVFGPLGVGARVVLAPEEGAREPARLAARMRTAGVTDAHFVPSLLRALLDEPTFAADGALRRVYCGGEAMTPDLAARLAARVPGCEIVHQYGPTETSIVATTWRFDGDPTRTSLPIGRPVANLRAYVLDAYGEPVPPGAMGALHLGGLGVARGYAGRPGLTAQRFVPDPFAGIPGARMYDTGDRARWLADGTLEFAGRLDGQVKIRGMRVELGEIEATLAPHPDVGASAVVLQSDVHAPTARLTAWIVPRTLPPPPMDEMRAFLRSSLPEHMVPTDVVYLDALPLSPNGKVDRRSLSSRPIEPASHEVPGYVAPRTPVEATLAEVLATLLRVPRVSVDDDFFALGGDSILSIQFVARATRAGVALTARLVFEHPTIAGMAAHAVARASIATHDDGPGPVPLTPIQRRFLEQEVPSRDHFNQSLLLEARAPLDVDALASAVEALVLRHAALRLRFAFDPTHGWTQRIVEHGGQSVFERRPVAATKNAIEHAAAEAQTSLDLANGPVFRVVFLEPAHGPARVLLLAHHLVVDAVSWRVLLEDLALAYGQRCAGDRVDLGPPPASYRAWATRLDALARSDGLQDEVDYWRALPWHAIAPLPLDHPEADDTVARSADVTVESGSEIARALTQHAARAPGIGPEPVLLAALAVALGAWTHSPVVAIDVEHHGREALFDDVDVSQTVGWFTAVQPAVIAIGDEADLVARVHGGLAAAPRRGLGHGAIRHGGTGSVAERALRALPAPEAVFNYLGRLDASATGGALAPAAESPGPERDPRATRPHRIEVTTTVLDGQLRTRFVYGSAVFERASIEALVAGFTATLDRLLAAAGTAVVLPREAVPTGDAAWLEDALASIEVDEAE